MGTERLITSPAEALTLSSASSSGGGRGLGGGGGAGAEAVAAGGGGAARASCSMRAASAPAPPLRCSERSTKRRIAASPAAQPTVVPAIWLIVVATAEEKRRCAAPCTQAAMSMRRRTHSNWRWKSASGVHAGLALVAVSAKFVNDTSPKKPKRTPTCSEQCGTGWMRKM